MNDDTNNVSKDKIVRLLTQLIIESAIEINGSRKNKGCKINGTS